MKRCVVVSALAVLCPTALAVPAGATAVPAVPSPGTKTLFAATIADVPITRSGSMTAVVHFGVIGGTARYFDCTLQGPGHAGAVGKCKSPAKYPHLAAGDYTFKVWAVSPTGQSSAKASAYFLIH